MNIITERIHWRPRWTIRRYADDEAYRAGRAYDESVIEGNLLLSEGIGVLLDLLAGLGSPTAYSNANAYIGVGDSTTAAAAGQTGLQATTNKAYAAMADGYPSRSGTTITWRAVFGSGAAEFDWREFTVINGPTDSAINLNRVVSSQGTKGAGQTWTVDLQVTIS